MEQSHRAGHLGEKENHVTNAGIYICKHCSHTSSSLAATRDHLEGFHKDKVITDDDFIASVIYRQTSSESFDSESNKATAANDKKKSSTIRCKLCCESFVEGKEYMRHLKSCRAMISSQTGRSSSPTETTAKTSSTKASRGRTARGGSKAAAAAASKVKVPELNNKRQTPAKKRGRGAKANVGQRRPKSSTSSRPGDLSSKNVSTGRGSPQNGSGSGGTRSSATSQYHPALDKVNSPLPYCELCDKQFSMQTTYQIHMQSKEHKALEQAKVEEEKTRNKSYSCCLCPDQGPWKHKRLLKQHFHTFQHKMAKKVEAMVSRIFTDQPFDENFSELQEERRQQLMQEEREKLEKGEISGVTSGIPSGNSDTEDTMTTSSSAPSPSAAAAAGSCSNLQTMPNNNSGSCTALNTQGTKNTSGLTVSRGSKEELEERVRKMLEPAKRFCLPPPPVTSRLRLEDRDRHYSSAFGVTIINDIPNHALPIDLDLSIHSADQLTTFSGEQIQLGTGSTSPDHPAYSAATCHHQYQQNSDLQVWEEAIHLMHKVASYSTFWNYRTAKQQNLSSATVAPASISVVSPSAFFNSSTQEQQHKLTNML